MSDRVVFRSQAVVLPDRVTPATVHVHDGVIVAIGDHDDPADVDVGDFLLLPGLVDSHVHLNDPGRVEWEGFASGTLAAAAGGITTVVDMPLNSVPATTTVSALDAKLAAAAGECHVDVAFWGGLVPDNIDELEPLWRAAVCGFKCFMTPSGVPEFEHVDEDALRRALPILARLGAPLLVHAELPAELVACALDANVRAYEAYLATRPVAAETAAVELLIRLARETGAHIHVVHVSAADTVAVLRAARADGVAITAETCPHYLHFAAESIPAGRTEFKCAPPIRSESHREQLWDALLAGDLDLVASDHSPAPPTLKQCESGNYIDAWGGIASLQLALPVMWTGATARGVRIEQVAHWLSSAPAHLAGIDARKGAIAPGRDADIVVFDPDAVWHVSPESLHHRHALTPYAGEELRGRVMSTYLRGRLVYSDGAIVGARSGATLTRLT